MIHYISIYPLPNSPAFTIVHRYIIALIIFHYLHMIIRIVLNNAYVILKKHLTQMVVIKSPVSQSFKYADLAPPLIQDTSIDHCILLQTIRQNCMDGMEGRLFSSRDLICRSNISRSMNNELVGKVYFVLFIV